ncbi:MAG: hypothetical protein KVP17_003068 [Porospora cf. gigantea B]|uniref:uncharacterized protein n=1 Tax=Porospora cf. gigantea B TaxID=2853592 RepID=UPI0035719B2A|nr:MAG: hypothetical protein KVP17_003068 [Porospora cf. gigantea B]
MMTPQVFPLEPVGQWLKPDTPRPQNVPLSGFTGLPGRMAVLREAERVVVSAIVELRSWAIGVTEAMTHRDVEEVAEKVLQLHKNLQQVIKQATASQRQRPVDHCLFSEGSMSAGDQGSVASATEMNAWLSDDATQAPLFCDEEVTEDTEEGGQSRWLDDEAVESVYNDDSDGDEELHKRLGFELPLDAAEARFVRNEWEEAAEMERALWANYPRRKRQLEDEEVHPAKRQRLFVSRGTEHHTGFSVPQEHERAASPPQLICGSDRLLVVDRVLRRPVSHASLCWPRLRW